MPSRLLVFDSWGVFTDTFEPYRRWTSSGPIPEHYMRRGDQIFELSPETDYRDTWRGCRFQARRGGTKNKILDDLEDWQAAKLFGGELPPWPLEGDVLMRIHAALLDIMPAGKSVFASVLETTASMMRRMADELPEDPPYESDAATPEERLAVQAAGTTQHWIATGDVPGTPVREGDVLVNLTGGLEKVRRLPPRTRAIQVPRELYPAVTEHPQAIRAGGCNLSWSTTSDLLKSLAKSHGHAGRARPESAPLIILRRLTSAASEPIRAPTDAGAIFELIHDAGGRMPVEED